MRIITTGFPGPGKGRLFVEVEDDDGRIIDAGEWRKREDGLAELVLEAPTPSELSTLRRLRAGELVAVEAAQAAGLAAGTHVVVPVDVLLAVLDEAAADSIYASCKCLSPDEAAISRHHQERIEQLRGLAAAQKEG